MRLRRRYFGEKNAPSEKYLPAEDVANLCRDGEQPPFIFGDEFSKLSAIQKLHDKLTKAAPTEEDRRIVRWLLSDRGLLYAQTRERDDTAIGHNWRRYAMEHEFYQDYVNAGAEQPYYEEALRLTEHYCPALSADQADNYTQLVQRFRKEDLSTWTAALPALKQCLEQPFLFERAGEDPTCEEIFNACIDLLRDSIQQYLYWEGILQEKTQERMAAALSDVIVQYGWREFPGLMRNPAIIFSLVRAPYFRQLYIDEENRRNKETLLRIMCTALYVPVTSKTMAADEKLFLAILDACELYCKASQKTFDKSAWSAFWDCIEAVTECLTFEVRDMFCTRHSWTSVIRYGEHGMKLLDRWLERRFAEWDNSYCAALWRALQRTYLSPDTDQAWLMEHFPRYKELFQCPTSDFEEVDGILNDLCLGFGWNKIGAGIRKDEVKELKDLLKTEEEGMASPQCSTPKSRRQNKTVAAINSAKEKNSKKAIKHPRIVELQMMEWLALQRASSQAKRELMDCVVAVLEGKQIKVEL